MQGSKNPPRFLPTLTEVVHPAALIAEAVAPSVTEIRQAHVVSDEMVSVAVAQLLPALEQRIRATLQESLQSQVDALVPQLMADLQQMLETAVSNSVSDSSQSHRPD